MYFEQKCGFHLAIKSTSNRHSKIFKSPFFVDSESVFKLFMGSNSLTFHNPQKKSGDKPVELRVEPIAIVATDGRQVGNADGSADGIADGTGNGPLAAIFVSVT